MNDYGKDRCYYGPSKQEIERKRRKARLEWLNSLRRNHR